MTADDLPGLSSPAHIVPVPRSVSVEAPAYLASGARKIAALTSATSTGAAEDANAALIFLRPRAAQFDGEVVTIDLDDGAMLHRVVPNGSIGRLAEVSYFDIHGGGFVAGGGEMCLLLAKLRAMELGVEVWSVDYRLAPQYPYPAALDDCIAAYRYVLDRRKATDLVVAGASAGGNLAAAMLLRGSDEGLPMPAGLIMATPGTDLTMSGDTLETNRYHDVALFNTPGTGPLAYLGNADPHDPYVSPLYGAFTANWPPTFLSSGTRDVLLSDTVRMHRRLRRAGASADLHVTEAGPHGGFMGSAPEDHELIAESRKFCREAWKVS